MKFLTIIWFLITLSACGRDVEIEDQFKPLIELYLTHAPTSGAINGLRQMKAGPLPAPDSGYTQRFEEVQVGVRLDRYTHVTVVPDDNHCQWTRAVLHELGHALHGFGHSEDPSAIMFYSNTTDANGDWCNDLGARLDRMFQTGGHH